MAPYREQGECEGRKGSQARRLLIRLLSATVSSLLLGFLVSSNLQAYTVDPRVWPQPSTTFTIDSGFTLLGMGWDPSLLMAADDWNRTGLFTFANAYSSSNIIRAGYVGGDLARTKWYWDRLGRVRFEITVDPAKPWYDGSSGPSCPADRYCLQTILRHELGHALGLMHTPNTSRLMKRQWNMGQHIAIGPDELDGLRYLYGSTSAGASPENYIEAEYPRLTAGKYNEDHDRVGYARGDWTLDLGFPKPYLSTIAYQNVNGSKVWVAFTGSSLTRHYSMTHNRGYVHVFLDGSYLELINDNAGTTRWQVAKTWTMPAGNHLMEFRLPDSPGGSGPYMDSDAYTVNISSCATGAY